MIKKLWCWMFGHSWVMSGTISVGEKGVEHEQDPIHCRDCGKELTKESLLSFIKENKTKIC